MGRDLASMECVPCRGGVPPLDRTEIESYLSDLGHEWRVVDDHHLEKEYRFADFKEALAFTNRVGELVVRGARHHATAEPRDRRRREDAAGRTRCEHVALSVVHLVGADCLSVQFLRELLRANVVGVGQDQAGPVVRELAREGLAHGAHALDRDRPPTEIVGAERVRDRAPQAVEHADRRRRRGSSRAARRLGLGEDEGGALAYDVHIGRGGVHVARGPVRPMEGLHQIPIAQQELASADAGGGLGHREHRLAAAEREPGHRVLARHGGG